MKRLVDAGVLRGAQGIDLVIDVAEPYAEVLLFEGEETREVGATKCWCR